MNLRLRRIAAIFLRQIYLMRSSLTRIMPLFIWVAIDIILWGFITRYLNSIASPGFNFVPALLGAVLFWDFFTRVMHGVSMAFLEDVWSRNFLNVFATPLTTAEYVIGLVLTSIVTSAVGLIVMIVLATSAFRLSFWDYGLLLFPFIGVLFLFGIAIGIIASGIMLRYGPASEWFIWPIPAIISPFVGVFYPIATLPAWMQPVSYLLPPSYIFEAMRALVTGKAVSWAPLLAGGAFCLVYIIAACWFFLRVYRHAVRTGLIARYSAETIS